MRPSVSINAGVSGGNVIAPSHPYNPSKTRPSSFLFHKTTGHGVNLKMGLSRTPRIRNSVYRAPRTVTLVVAAFVTSHLSIQRYDVCTKNLIYHESTKWVSNSQLTAIIHDIAQDPCRLEFFRSSPTERKKSQRRYQTRILSGGPK